jgi:hypothetical protein
MKIHMNSLVLIKNYIKLCTYRIVWVGDVGDVA